MRKFYEYLLLLLGVFSASTVAYAQNFSDFFSDFIRFPESQYQNVKFPLVTENGTIKGKNGYVPIKFLTKNSLPILFSDSLGLISSYSSANVTIIDFMKNNAKRYLFDKKKKGWLLSAQLKETPKTSDSEFIAFLKEFSSNEEFQKKHTIFPFPYRRCSSGKCNETEANLLMPREWEFIDFKALFPSICVFYTETMPSVNNRRLAVFKKDKLSSLFNFIKINGKWYFIEIEEYD